MAEAPNTKRQQVIDLFRRDLVWAGGLIHVPRGRPKKEVGK